MDEPEVIQDNMEQTRQSLAAKLDHLERKVVGTVETVTDSVQKTVESVSETVESVKDNVQETVENVTEGVSNVLDISGHVRNYPWAMLGGSVAVGFVAGRLMGRLFPASAGQRLQAADFGPETHGGVPPSVARGTTATRIMYGNGHGSGPASPAPPAEPPRPASKGLLGSLLEQFAPQIEQLKELALGTTIGVARDLIVRSLPESLKQDVTGFMNDLARNVGGKPIEGPLVPEDEGQPAAASGSGEGYRPGGWAGRG